MSTAEIAGNVSANTTAAYLPGNASQTDRNKQPGMDTNLFMQLLVAQLRYQDPFSGGQDPGQMISQLAMFTLLEQVVKVQQAVARQEYISQQTVALDLLNQVVEVIDDEGVVSSGLVTAVSFRDQQPYLTVNDQEYPYSALIGVGGGMSSRG